MGDRGAILATVADLTWTDLYTNQIRKELKPLIRNVKRLPPDVELVKHAERLRQQLKVANHTFLELKKWVEELGLKS
jgi:hypothetical protein